VALVEEQRALGGATLVHCNAGMGRTGTMLAAYLIAAQGVPAREAIATLRRMRPGSVQVRCPPTYNTTTTRCLVTWIDGYSSTNQPTNPHY
jgi:protein-tyrosine phosphatase